MSGVKIVAASIVNFLKQQLDSDTLSVDARESVEVGVQCIETAFELGPEEMSRGIDLLQLLRQHQGRAVDRAEAEQLKNEGNELMKAKRYREALEKYSRAIEMDPRNSVYFCNRAAAHFNVREHEAAVADCTAAIALQPDYGKAHGRLGLALSALERHREARSAYARAAQLAPDNESYRRNLRHAEERLAQRGDRAQPDLGGLQQNPALLNMAMEMLTDPNMQNLIAGLMNTTATAGNGAGGVNAVREVGQVLAQHGHALAQHMLATNPDLVEQLRRQDRPPGRDGSPPPTTQ